MFIGTARFFAALKTKAAKDFSFSRFFVSALLAAPDEASRYLPNAFATFQTHLPSASNIEMVDAADGSALAALQTINLEQPLRLIRKR